MDDFLILLQAKIDEAKSKGNINKDIDDLQRKLDKLKLQVTIDPNAAQTLAKEIEKVINQKIIISNIGIDSNSTIKAAQQTGQKIGDAINQGVTNTVSKTTNSLKSFTELKIGTGNIDAVIDKDGILDIEQSLNRIKQIYSEFGQVKITNKIFDADGTLKEFRVNIQQVNGELKESRNFMMALASDGKSFNFPQDVIKGSESLVHHLNEAKNVSNATGEELNAQKAKLAEQEKYYSQIKSEVNLLYNLEQKLLSADELQTAELEKQIKSTKQRITYNNQQIDKKNLRDDSLDREITNLEVAKQKQLALSDARTRDSANVKAVNAALKEQQSLQSQVNKIQLSFDTGGYESKVESLIAKTRQWTDQNGEARISTNALSIALENLKTASNTLSNSNTVENQKALVTAEKELDTQIKKVTNSVKSMNAQLAKDSAVSSLHNKVADFMSKNGKAVKYYGTELNRVLNETAHGASLTDAQVRQLNQDFNNTVITARNAGKLGKTWFQTLRDGMSSFSYWTSSTFLVMKAIQSVKGGISSVKALDTALVDLKKTTTMTTNELEEFYYSSNKVAKQMGVTTEEIINQAAAWSRLK